MINKKTPEQLLEEIQTEEAAKRKGKLTIFFGYAAGVGKTYAMLQAAHKEAELGKKVLAGYIEPHTRPETIALLEGLDVLSCKVYEEGNIILREFDIDAAIAMKPDILLVDEFAHTNTKGCRHRKRYQDILEVLNAGIDVYTTVNVQHIESLNDQVAAITGIIVRERIPDTVFDAAAAVKLVDIEPAELKARLDQGKIYKTDQAQRALNHFFTIDHLSALREIATRRCADRMNLLAMKEKNKANGSYYTAEHILVCLSSSPSNAKIIRTGARMARAHGGRFTALFVETSGYEKMSQENKKRVAEHTHLARQLGAVIETTYGDDVPFQIAEYARQNGISKIVLGRNTIKNGIFYHPPTLVDKLTSYAPDMDIYIIPDTMPSSPKRQRLRFGNERSIHQRDLVFILCTLLCTTNIGLLFHFLKYQEANIIMVYILGIVIIAVTTYSRILSILSCVFAVILFNFFFTEPYYTLNVVDSNYVVTFVIMFISAFLISTLSVKLRQNELLATQNAYFTRQLFQATQQLQNASEEQEVISITAAHLKNLLDRSIAYFPFEADGLKEPLFFSVRGKRMEIDEHEKAVATWVADHNRRAGATTSTLPDARYLYLAVRAKQKVYGVVGITIDEEPLKTMEYNSVIAILGECAMCMDRLVIRKEQEVLIYEERTNSDR